MFRPPELSRFASESQAQRALHDSLSKLKRAHRIRGFLIAAAFIAPPMIAWDWLRGSSGLGLVYAWTIVLGVAGLLGLAGSLTEIWLLRSAVRRELRRQLIARGVAICMTCGYDLRGQTAPRCPECGTSGDGGA